MKNNAPLFTAASWVAFILWAAGIVWLSSLGPQQFEEVGPWFLRLLQLDKLVHCIAFMIGAVLLAYAVRLSTSFSSGGVLRIVILGISLFGAIDEWHQLSTPGRSGADVGDWLADTIGAVLGTCVFFYTHGRFGIRARPPADTAAPARS